MKKYKSVFNIQNSLPKDILKEAVLNPDNYLTLLQNNFLELKNEILSKKLNVQKLCSYLSTVFYNDKIIFKYEKDSKQTTTGVVKGGYNPTTNNILVICDQYIIDIQQSEDDFFMFLEDAIEFIGHELVHRLQFLKDKIKVVHTYVVRDEDGIINVDEMKKYLSDQKEIMAHAWQTIQIFKMMGISDQANIFEIINKRKMQIIRYNDILFFYIKYIDKNSDIYKKYFKYIFQYLNQENQA